MSLKALISRLLLLAWAGLCLAAVLLSERYQVRVPDPRYRRRLEAARLMRQGMEAIREEGERRGIELDPRDDPNRTGLIGPRYTAITTTLGPLEAKRTATNPDMAAVLVGLLAEAGLGPGDAVAAGFSGSFPGLNLAVLAAVRAFDGELLAVSSIGASTYGATDPAFTWIDMEAALYRAGLFPWRSLAAAPGGASSGAEVAVIARSGLPVLPEGDLAADVARRTALYRERAGSRTIRVFINVGGAQTNLGRGRGSGILPTGRIRRLPSCPEEDKGVIHRMAEQGVAVINLLQVRELALRHGLPLDPIPLPQSGLSRPYRGKPPALLPTLLLLVLAPASFLLVRRLLPFVNRDGET